MTARIAPLLTEKVAFNLQHHLLKAFRVPHLSLRIIRRCERDIHVVPRGVALAGRHARIAGHYPHSSAKTGILCR